MSRFFSIDNVIFRGISRMGDMLLLSLMTVICCVPVFTAGAALTALFDVSIKILRGRDTGTLRNYFTSFGRNFLQSTVIWMLYAPIGIALYFLGDLAITQITDEMLKLVVGGICVGLIVLYAFSLLFVFPVQAVFENKISATIRTAFLMSLKHWGTTLALLAGIAAVVYLCWLMPLIAYFMLIIGVGAFALIYSTRFLTIFRKYNASLNPDEEELTYHPMVTKEQERRARALKRNIAHSGKVIH